MKFVQLDSYIVDNSRDLCHPPLLQQQKKIEEDGIDMRVHEWFFLRPSLILSICSALPPTPAHRPSLPPPLPRPPPLLSLIDP